MAGGWLPVSVIELVAGSTLLLGSGTLAAVVARAPVDRQRAAELTVTATLVWLVLALVPLPRWSVGLEAWRAGSAEPAVVGGPAGASTGQRSGSSTAASKAEPAAVRRPAPASFAAGGGPSDLSTPVAPRGAAHGASPDAGIATATQESGAAGGHSVRSPAEPDAWWGRIAAGHAIISLLVAGWVLLGLVLVRRLVATSAAPPSWLDALFAERRRALGVRRAELRIGRGRRRPLAAGLLRPTVILPAALATPDRASELHRIVDHELVHVRRGDVLGRTMFALAAPLLWVHPLYWWLRARAALAAELIADDVAAAGDRSGYARDLLALADDLRLLHPAPGHAPGTFRNRPELTRRIDMLISRHDPLSTRCSPRRRLAQALGLILALGGVVAVFGARPLPAQQDAPPVVPQAPVAPAGDERAPTEPAAAPAADVAAPESVDDATAPAPPDDITVPAPPDVSSASAAAHERQLPPAAQEPDPGYAATLALVDRALMLQSELELARAELALKGRVTTVEADDIGLVRAQITMQGLERRLAAVRTLIESEIEATKLELVQLDQALRIGTEGPEARVQQLRLVARLKVLEGAF